MIQVYYFYKMFRRYALGIIFFFASIQLMYAQQDPLIAHYMYAPAVYNPALNGIDNVFSATGVFRAQWVGLPGNPVTEWLNVQSPISNHFGGGIDVSNDQAGELRNTTLNLAGAFYINMPHSRFSLGVQAGFAQQSLDGSKLTTPDGNSFDHYDPHLPIGLATQTQPDAALGIAYISKHFTVGAAMEHFTAFFIKPANNFFQYTPAYYGYIQYRTPISKKLSMQINLLGESDGINTQTSISSLFEYKNAIWIGVGLRGYSSTTIDAAPVYIGFHVINHVIVGYSYEVGLSALRPYDGGSHEVMVKYAVPLFQSPRPGKVIYTPRF